MINVSELQSKIDRAAQSYYYGTPLVSDAVFDAWLAELKARAPDDHRLTRVGYPVPPDNALKKVSHTIAAHSLAKVDTVEELRKWYQKIGGGDTALSCQLKIDGNSLVLYYIKGRLDKAVTRGGDDGIGEDVTANAVRSIGVPTVLNKDFTCAVRGESVLMVDQWRQHDPEERSNPRNIGSGMLRRVEGKGAELLHFIAFDIVLANLPAPPYYGPLHHNDDLYVSTETEKSSLLRELGFTPVSSYCLDIDDAIKLHKRIEAERSKLPYWIDGVVFKIDNIDIQTRLGISHGRPKGQRVLKFESPGATTTITDIVLTVGHTGAIIPTAKLEPVQIAGTTVSNALLNNFTQIAEMDLAIGDKVRVVKAKDIIPQIVEVIDRPANRRPIASPKACPVCDGDVGLRQLVNKANEGDVFGRVLECKNHQCAARSLAKIKTWIKKLDIKDIGDGVLDSMVTSFVLESPADLYRLNAVDLAVLSIGNGKLGDKRAKKIITNIQQKRVLPINMFMGSLGIPHLGRRRVQLIREAVPGELDTVDDWRSGKIEALAGRAGIPNMGAAIHKGIDAFGPVIDDLLKFVTIEDSKEVPVATSGGGGKFAGMVVCFTGKIDAVDPNGKRYTRDRMQQLVVENGGTCTDDVQAITTHLVQADPSSESSKTKKAKKLGVTIMAEEEFFAELGK